MNDTLPPTIMNNLTGYLAGGMELDDLMGWFLGETYDVRDADLSAELNDLIYGVKLAWAEYTDESVDRSEEWFRRECDELVRTAHAAFPTAGLDSPTAAEAEPLRPTSDR